MAAAAEPHFAPPPDPLDCDEEPSVSESSALVADLNCTEAVEDKWENQRYLFPRWRKPFLPTDRREWTDSSGKIRRAVVALPPGWDWATSSWECIVDKDTTDTDGWMYASDFKGPYYNKNWLLASTRRRCWRRKRVPKKDSAGRVSVIRDESTMCGFLTKRGEWKRLSHARRRFFVLRDSILFYYRTDVSEYACAEPVGAIPLSEIAEIWKFSELGDKGFQHGLALRSDADRTWQLNADSSYDQHEWYEKLMDAIFGTRPASQSVIEGRGEFEERGRRK